MRTWKPDATAVAAKVIDGEAIIMNLTNGAYYSMDGVGAVIWEGFEQLLGGDAIVERIASRYGVDLARVRVDFDQLVGELLAEGLIVESETDMVSALHQAGSAIEIGYSSPALNKYTEMADLLALDPPMPSLQEIPGATPRVG